ncbi:Radical SAM [uncultured Desulfobacterium sp.]|uniref:Radical SAM n=1 Tax=uncultured Desulfobacterium sp. TaxID=201089 RepID=A0A445N1S3_9BACT|nr:Radical SAM [uncultured Desulfobacterium sp.]
MSEKKKILFIAPARRRPPDEEFVFKMGFLNLPYLAAVTPPDYDVAIIDEEYEKIPFSSEIWLAAISAQTPVAPQAYKVADQFRRLGVTVVMGGPHASTQTDEALGHVDSVIVGEGEFIWPNVLTDLENGQLKPLYDGGVSNSLNALAWPRRDLLKSRFYIPLTMIETTRGCPHQCDFCGVSKFFGHKYRKRPIKDVEDELTSLFSTGFRHRASRIFARLGLDLPYFLEKRLIYFIDSNFAADINYTRQLINILNGLDVLWWGHTTVDIAWDDDFLGLMAASGCIAVNIGFESLSQENLRSMRKSFAGVLQYSEAISRIHSHGIGIMGTFVAGFDGEDISIFDRIYSFVLENRLDWALVFIHTPYPGTSFFEQMERSGRLTTTDWEKYDTLNCVFAPMGMTDQEMERALKKTWKKIFSLRSIRHRILKRPYIHPMFYLGMNMQFFQMVRRWKV